jgi:flavin reductase (DIM6/NTAB) family NADH-FMN oxidoreductase RutF
MKGFVVSVLENQNHKAVVSHADTAKLQERGTSPPGKTLQQNSAQVKLIGIVRNRHIRPIGTMKGFMVSVLENQNHKAAASHASYFKKF